MTRHQKLLVFGVLLVVLLGLTVLFASGTLRFGQSGPIVYILYVIAGFGAAVLTFGLLASSGTFSASNRGMTLRLGGSVVALLAVAAGGGLYERYLHRAETFELLIVFWMGDSNSSAPLIGEMVLYAGNNDFPKKLDGSGRARFLSLPSQLLGRPINFMLNVPGYQVVEIKPNVFENDKPIQVQVERSQTYADASTALAVMLSEAQVVDYGPRPDQRILTITLKLNSRAGLPLPLSRIANLRIFTETGGPMWDVPLQSHAAFVLAEPGLSSVTYEGMIDRFKYESLAGGRLGEIVLQYDSMATDQSADYSTGQMHISTETFIDLSKP
jgi:hypothetical protein